MNNIVIILSAISMFFCFNTSVAQNFISPSPALIDSIENGLGNSVMHDRLGSIYYHLYLDISGEEGHNQEIYQKVIDNYEKAIQLDPEYALAHLNLGILYNPYGWIEKQYTDFDKSIKHLNKSIALKVENSEIAYYNLAIAIYSKYIIKRDGDDKNTFSTYFNKSVSYHLKALEINPNYWQSYQKLGRQYYSQKYYFDYNKESLDSSLMYYEKSVAINTSDYNTMKLIGDIYKKSKNTERAIYFYEKSVNLNTGTDAFYYLIFLYKNMKLYDVAIETYERLLPVKPKDTFVNIYPQLADIYDLVGDKVNGDKYRQIHLDFKKK